MPDVSWLAVLAAAISTFVLGGLWYSPAMGNMRCFLGQLGPLLAGTLVACSTQPPETVTSDERSVVEPVTDRIIHLTARVSVPPGRAFEYFTSSDLLVSWLTEAAEVEPRVGGKYELFWEPADRENNSTIGCRVTALQENQFIAFQWRSPKQFKAFANAADPLTHVAVLFVPEGRGTRIHLIHTGWRSTVEWEEARLWQERAWSGAFEALERAAAQLPHP